MVILRKKNKKAEGVVMGIILVVSILILIVGGAIAYKLYKPEITGKVIEDSQIIEDEEVEEVTQCEEECYIFNSVYCEELTPSAAFVYCEIVDGCPKKQILDYCGNKYCKCATSWSFSYGGEIHNKKYYDKIGVNLKEKKTYTINRGEKIESCWISKIYTVGYTRSGDANSYIWALSFCNELQETQKKETIEEEKVYEEIGVELICIARCNSNDPIMKNRPLVDLMAFDYKKVGSMYQVEATFKSNTACDVSFLIEGGKKIGGNIQLEGFGSGKIIIETKDLFNLKILPHDTYNNIHVGEYQCGGMASNMLFEFV